MNPIIEKINGVFKKVNLFMKDNDLKMRNCKSSIEDVLYYKFMYSQIDTTKQQIVSAINYDNDKSINRTSFYKKEKNISISVYKNIFKEICKVYDSLTDNCDKTLILAVDGTFNNTNYVRAAKTLQTSLNMCVYDAFNKIPVDLTFNGPNIKNNEVCEFEKYINKNSLSNDSQCIFVCDRGYFKYELFKNLDEKNMNFVIRIKENCKLLDDKYVCDKYNKNLSIMNYIKDKKFRIIEYTVPVNKILISKNKELKKVEYQSTFYLITNLGKEYNDSKIKDIYKSRWNIEVFFKYLKSNHKFAALNEKRKDDYEKMYTIELILIYILKIIKIISTKKKKEDNFIKKRMAHKLKVLLM